MVRYYTWKLQLVSSILQLIVDYVDIIHDQPNNLILCNKTETCQYNAALVITSAIRGPSKETLHQELGFEYLTSRRWLRKLSTFSKIVRNKSPGCLCKYILPGDHAYLTRKSNNIKQTFCRLEYFANSFFPYTITQQIPNSLWEIFSHWDPQNETLNTHYEKKIQKPP